MRRLTWAMALLGGVVLAAGGGCGDPDEDGPDDEVCDNGLDDDDDGYTDCDDSDCAGFSACVGTGEICGNGRDDDGDGDVDCDDSECADDPACDEPLEELCDNGADDDEDGDVDCDDSDCVDDPACGEPVDEVCDNDLDDDGDTLVDCDDPDCLEDSACAEPLVEVCDNDLDDDGDRLVDCDDPDCEGDPACEGPVEICDNDGDDDGDGLADCMDPDCDLDAACPELCNGLDDDGDGRVDESPIDPTLDDPCYEGPAAAAGVGQCEMGSIQCFGGHLLCLGWVAPLEEELCDGIDNDCDGSPVDEEVAAGCSTTIVPGDPSRIEFQTQVRDVDVHVNLDTTGSMGGSLSTLTSTLSTTIVPEVRAMLPTAEFGVSTFDDFPLGGFGSDGVDLPFDLHQRITANVPFVQTALDAITLHSGNDGPESGIESLYQIATGAGTSWPGVGGWTAEECDNLTDDDGDGLVDCADPDCAIEELCSGWPAQVCSGSGDEDGDGYAGCDDPDCAGSPYCAISAEECPALPAPGLRAITTQVRSPGTDVDPYSVSVAAGSVVTVQMFASRAGSPLDAYIRIYDQASGAQLAANDDYCGLDSRLVWTAASATSILVYGTGYSSSTGWYAMHVDIDGVQHVADRATCSALEVGEAAFPGGVYDPSLAIPLVPAGSHYPIADIAACLADCEVALGDWADSGMWATRFCEGPPAAGVCGDGTRDYGEECDDGDLVDGDGCDGDCLVELGCGNALLEPGEACDDGNTAAGDGCSPTCTLEAAVCGNRVVDPGEQCDDGGLVGGDGCDASCMLEPACGNGALDAGEACDDGNLRSGDGCDALCALERPSVPVFDWSVGFDPGLGHGTVGGVGFRATALPVVVHITDAVSHECTDYTSYDPTIDAHCSAETFAALNAIGARVLPVATYTGSATSLLDPLGMAYGTGSVVPLCAFDGSDARTSGRCAADQCCTGLNGAGVAPDAAGECPLAFRIDWGGTGLDTSIVSAIDALTQFVRYELTVVPRDDPSDAVDALCFVESIGIVDHMGPSGSCAVTPVPVDADGDGVVDTLVDATPRTRVTFEIDASATDVNDVDGDGNTTEACAGVGTYGLYLDVVAEGGTVVATRRVEVDIL